MNKIQIAVGLVLYNNSYEEVNRFQKSFESAARVIEEKFIVDLVVVDNSSGSISKHLRLEPYVKILRTGINTGYTEAMALIQNHVFNQCHYRILISANPDGAFHYKCLDELLKLWHRNPDSIIEAIQFPEEHPKKYNKKTFETEWASGCCLLIPKHVFMAIGPLDTNFFMYMEDVDYSWRARQNGFKVLVCPNALYGHYVMNRTYSEFVDRQMLLSAYYLGLKWKNNKFVQRVKAILGERFGYLEADFPLYNFPEHFPMQVPFTNFEKDFSFSDVRW